MVHNFKQGQYYKRRRDGLVYKIVPCQAGALTYNSIGPCGKICSLQLMLQPKDGETDHFGYCAKGCQHMILLKKLTKLEALLQNY